MVMASFSAMSDRERWYVPRQRCDVFDAIHVPERADEPG
jgi:hypothetical protein